MGTVVLFIGFRFWPRVPITPKNYIYSLIASNSNKGKRREIAWTCGLSFAYLKTAKRWMWVMRVTKEAITDVPISSR